MRIYGNNEDFSNNPALFKKIAAYLASYVEKSLNTSAHECLFEKITTSSKDQFDISIKNAIEHLKLKKLVESYFIYSWYKKGQSYISFILVVEATHFSKNSIMLKYSVSVPKANNIQDIDPTIT